MPVSYIPHGFHTVTPYIVVEGVSRLIEFLKEAFGAELTEPPSYAGERVMHASMKIGDSIVMMGEPMESSQAMPANLYLYVEDCDALYQKGLAAGATSLQEPTDMFYGDRNSGLKDPLGNRWWIGTHVEDVSPDEMKRRLAELGQKRG